MLVRRNIYTRLATGGAMSALLLAVAGCGTAAPSPDGGLRFGLPSSPTAVYTTGDSLNITVDSPMGALTLEMDSEMTLEMSFERTSGGIKVTADVADFDASLSNPMTGTTTADESSVAGPLVFVVAADGDVTVDTLPTVSGGAEQLRPFLSLPHEIFPRLPVRAVAQGASWIDTVSWGGSPGEGSFASTTVYTHTLAGDTMIAGTRLLNISVTGEVSLDGSMESGGFDIEQSLSGTTTGFYLWDPVGGLLHAAELNRSLEGSLRVPSMNLPAMPIRAEGPVRTRVRS